MRSSSRIGLGSAVLVAAGMVAGSMTLAPAGKETSPADIQDPIPSPFVDREQLQEFRELTARQQATMARIAMKREVMAELIQGQATLPEAAARFAEITERDPDGMALLRIAFPEATDDERHYRNVIAFVRGELARQPDRGRTLVERLEAEFRARFPVTREALGATGS